MTTTPLTPDALKNGFVITKSGDYYLTGPVLFEMSSGVPDRCLDDNGLGVPIFGLRIEAPNVSLDLKGFSIAQSKWSVNRHRDFSCIAVTLAKGYVEIRNGTVGRSSDTCIWCSGARMTFVDVIVADYEKNGIYCEKSQQLHITNCVVGRPTSARRPKPEASLSLRYWNAVTDHPELLTELEEQINDPINPMRHEGAKQFGVAFFSDDDSRGTVDIEGLVVLELSLTIPSHLSFLSRDGTTEGVPTGPGGDPVSEQGASELRQRLHAALGADPSSQNEHLLRLYRAQMTQRACSTTAPNMPNCSSCRYPKAPLPQPVVKLWNFDATLERNFTAAAMLLKGAASYRLKDLSLRAPTVKTRSSKDGELLILDQCGPGTIESTKTSIRPMLLRNSPRPIGDCVVEDSECPYNAAWLVGEFGTSTTVSRPVGNIQNVQISPAFLPAQVCRPRAAGP